MYSTAKHLSTICAILSAINITACLLFFLWLANSEIGFTLAFTITLFLISSSGLFVLLTLCIRHLCQDLIWDYEKNVENRKKLEEKVKELEYKCK